MKVKNTAGNRFIQKKDGIIGPVEPKPVAIQERKREEYPDVHPAYLDIAEMLGPRYGGPPLCDQWVVVLKHLFTEDEAIMVRHLKGARAGKTAAEIAEAEHRPAEEIGRILDVLTDDKRILLSTMNKKNAQTGDSEYITTGGKRIKVSAEEAGQRRYLLQPMLPGAWETILVRTSMDSLTEWHTKFVELFMPLYETGFTTIHLGKREPGIRYLPIGQSIEMNPMALPSDKLGVIFDKHTDFAVGLCQCRLGAEIIGNNCGRPMENCIAMGPLALREIEVGRMRRIDMKEALEIKVEAEESGLVSWTWQTEVGGSNSSCSCCGCCCMMMRTITEFDKPGYMAPPHFLPIVDEKKCTYCGKCAKACTMGAWSVNVKAKTRSFREHRCVGCGLCYVACDKEKAIELKPVKEYKVPSMEGVESASHPLAGISGVTKK